MMSRASPHSGYDQGISGDANFSQCHDPESGRQCIVFDLPDRVKAGIGLGEVSRQRYPLLILSYPSYLEREVDVR